MTRQTGEEIGGEWRVVVVGIAINGCAWRASARCSHPRRRDDE